MTLDYMTLILSIKLSGVNLPQYYDYDASNTTFLHLICHIAEVIYACIGRTHTNDMP